MTDALLPSTRIGSEEAQKCLTQRVVVWLGSVIGIPTGMRETRPSGIISPRRPDEFLSIFSIRRYCFSQQAWLLVENWREMDELILHWALLEE